MLRPPPPAPGAKLRELWSQDAVVLPGVFNAISALSAARAGAQGLYLSGAGVANSLLGAPDIGLATLTEFAQQASHVASVASVPVLADADTGFGEGWNVARTVMELERAGLAGIHLEDQVLPKRCGHLDGKSIIEPRAMAAKLRAAVQAKRDSSFVVVARTDARGVSGLEDSIERGRRYVDAGADAVFPEGLESESEFARYRAHVPGPLVANMTEFGKTPLIAAARFRELGFQAVIFPMSAFRVMLRALDDTYEELLRTGTQAGLLDRMRTRAELYELIDYAGYEERGREWDKT